MRTAKLVFGILSIVLSVMVLFQSCAAGVVDAIQAVGGTSGSAGMIVGVLMLAGGIVNIVTRDSRGGAIACFVLFGLAGVVAELMHGVFMDLIIWGVYCLIVAIINLLSLYTQFRRY